MAQSLRHSRSLWRRSCACLVILLSGWLAAAQTNSDLVLSFEQANKLYEQGQFAEAADAYSALLSKAGASPVIWFNLGNAHFKAGHLGRAIFSYRHAAQWAPRDPDIRANLRFARDTVKTNRPLAPSRWSRWVRFFSLDELTLAAIVALWIWLGVLTARFARVSLDRPLRIPHRLALGLTVFTASWLALATYPHVATEEAIVMIADTVVRYGPLPESQTHYSAPDGTELVILSTKGDWLQVKDSSDRIGWLQRDQVLLFP